DLEQHERVGFRWTEMRDDKDRHLAEARKTDRFYPNVAREDYPVRIHHERQRPELADCPHDPALFCLLVDPGVPGIGLDIVDRLIAHHEPSIVVTAYVIGAGRGS